MALAEAERTDLLAFMRTLTADQWAAPSLCTRWTVRDVA
ncbi:MAG: maleylpyruvate isomerase N-terminal domain-containing protein, partial [Actinomycetota bacterium]|nr:maleylpyruvate isomerase N-terminal domain-containing protein [Actinomycetota bacterium]